MKWEAVRSKGTERSGEVCCLGKGGSSTPLERVPSKKAGGKQGKLDGRRSKRDI